MMTTKQHSDYVDELYKMLCKIVRLHGQHSPQATAMSSIHSAELMAYIVRMTEQMSKDLADLGRVNNENA
jgi:hypothetical protein